jgi:uncharacterized protein (DUF4213/DUF364 family)
MISDELYDRLIEIAGEHYATDIRIGLGYTAVLLENGRCGLAYTLHEEEYDCCCVIPKAGTLTGRRVSELAGWLKSPDTTACAIGLAGLNAAIEPPAGVTESDILDLLLIGTGDVVGMVGFFGPLVDPIKKRARALHVFERQPDPEYGILPESAARDLLPQCQVVILSATTILNHTIDGLLESCNKAREIALLGPSTPFLPEVFRRRGITLLSGLEVINAPQVLRTVSEGGGTRQFGTAARKLSLRTKA